MAHHASFPRSRRRVPQGQCRTWIRRRLVRPVDPDKFWSIMPICPHAVEYEITESPARVWLGMVDDPRFDDEQRQLVTQLPCRAVPARGSAWNWGCLALIAHEAETTVTEYAQITCSLEDSGLITWLPRENAHLVPQDLPQAIGDGETYNGELLSFADGLWSAGIV